MAAVPESLIPKIIWDKKVKACFSGVFWELQWFLTAGAKGAQCVQEASKSYDPLLIKKFSLKDYIIFCIPSVILGPYNCIVLIFATELKLDFISGMLNILIIFFNNYEKWCQIWNLNFSLYIKTSFEVNKPIGWQYALWKKILHLNPWICHWCKRCCRYFGL